MKLMLLGDADALLSAIARNVPADQLVRPDEVQRPAAFVCIAAVVEHPGASGLANALNAFRSVRHLLDDGSPRIIIFIRGAARLAPTVLARLAGRELAYQVLASLPESGTRSRSKSTRRALRLLHAAGISFARMSSQEGRPDHDGRRGPMNRWKE